MFASILLDTHKELRDYYFCLPKRNSDRGDGSHLGEICNSGMCPRQRWLNRSTRVDRNETKRIESNRIDPRISSIMSNRQKPYFDWIPFDSTGFVSIGFESNRREWVLIRFVSFRSIHSIECNLQRARSIYIAF